MFCNKPSQFMKNTMTQLKKLILLALACHAAGCATAQTGAPQNNDSKPPQPLYETRAKHDPNGIGKFYMGREIARVMGHQGADWLDRPEREEEEKPSILVEALQLKPGDVVADIGAGTGYLSFRMAERVGPKGKVYATDIQQEMLDILGRRAKERKITNVEPVLGTIKDTGLKPESVDLIILVDVYHEFDHPYEMAASMARSLKPGGRLVFVEYRLEDPTVPIKTIHKMSEKQVIKEMTPHPLRWLKTSNALPRQHIIFFEKTKEAKQK
jgi:ubiquinone/menaquinone biosynthesis C-methylase UbiE